MTKPRSAPVAKQVIPDYTPLGWWAANAVVGRAKDGGLVLDAAEEKAVRALLQDVFETKGVEFDAYIHSIAVGPAAQRAFSLDVVERTLAAVAERADR